ncbi:MAG: hypothetical protein KF708_04935 [Pirellulales bacterium]|nr:hypothetical protein [Pirellulales bacterium]
MARPARCTRIASSLAVAAALVVMLGATTGCCCTGWTLHGDWSLGIAPGGGGGCYDGYDSCGVDAGYGPEGGCGIDGGCGGPCCGGRGGHGGGEEMHYGTGRFFPVPTQNVFRGPGVLPVPTQNPLQAPSELPVPARDRFEPPPDTGLLGPDNYETPAADDGAGDPPPAPSGESQVRDLWQPERNRVTYAEPARLRPIPRRTLKTDWIFEEGPAQPMRGVEQVTRRQQLDGDGWKPR